MATTEGSVSDHFNGFMGVDSKHAKRASAGRPSVKGVARCEAEARISVARISPSAWPSARISR